MAIKTVSQGTIPSVTIDRIQFTQVNISVQSKPPYKIALTAVVHPYGVDQNDNNVYSGDERKVVIPDAVAFIQEQTGQDLTDAMLAMQKIQEGLGLMAQVYFTDIEFDQYI